MKKIEVYAGCVTFIMALIAGECRAQVTFGDSLAVAEAALRSLGPIPMTGVAVNLEPAEAGTDFARHEALIRGLMMNTGLEGVRQDEVVSCRPVLGSPIHACEMDRLNKLIELSIEEISPRRAVVTIGERTVAAQRMSVGGRTLELIRDGQEWSVSRILMKWAS